MTDIAINTLAFHGYPLETALAEIARLGTSVEPVYISKYDPSLREEDFTEENARTLRRRLDGLRLKAQVMGSHMDLGHPDAVDIFRRRMEFARAIGAGTILTNAGRKSQEPVFYRNLERLAVPAEELDLVIALENPGDGQDQLLGTGVEGIAILEKMGLERVRLNYDFCNVWTHAKGTIRPQEELAAVLPYVGHLHVKNVKSCEGGWAVCGLDEGVIDYEELFRRFPALSHIPMSIELPIRFGYDADFKFGLRQTPAIPSLQDIAGILKSALDDLVTWVSCP
jgi:sugar phosphate isomerase/epimerase